MFRIAMCDDNLEFLRQEHQIAEQYLISIGAEYKIKMFSSGTELISENMINSYDLILLDYEMDGMTGFETAKIIKERSENTSIAFVTVFYEFSREGYRFDAIRYLVKQEPNFKAELQDCIDKAIRLKQRKKDRLILFEFMDKSRRVDPEKIIYIVADKHYLIFTILDGLGTNEYKIRDKMSNIITVLASSRMFSLVRTGQLINLKYVKTIDRKGIVWVTYADHLSKMFQASDSRRKEFISDYMRYLGEER